jgi:leucyl/phenylalanyl-tRNA---protein transferase
MPKYFFPHPLEEREDDILDILGDLSLESMLLAYHYGIFPWFNTRDFILWWHPLSRFCLFPEEVYISKSMMKLVRTHPYRITLNQSFEAVVNACGDTPRESGKASNWLGLQMRQAYLTMRREGYAHSIEIRRDNRLVGGLFGIALGKCFFGESMFSLEPNTSKLAFLYLSVLLKKSGFYLLDAQMPTEHLQSLNCKTLSDRDFFDILFVNRRRHMYQKTSFSPLSPQEFLEACAERRQQITLAP